MEVCLNARVLASVNMKGIKKEENLAPQDQSNPFLLVYQIHTSDASRDCYNLGYLNEDFRGYLERITIRPEIEHVEARLNGMTGMYILGAFSFSLM